MERTESSENLEDGLAPEEDPIDSGGSTVLNIMVENCADIENTVSLVKLEIAEHVNTPILAAHSEVEAAPPPQSPLAPPPPVEQFQALSKLWSDTRIKGMVQSKAGEGTTSIIDETLGAITLSSSSEDKKQALTGGLKKLHSNLEKTEKSIKNDPAYNLCLSLVGLSNLKKLS